MKVYCYNIKPTDLMLPSYHKWSLKETKGNLDSIFEAEITQEKPNLYQCPVVGDIIEIGKIKVKLKQKL